MAVIIQVTTERLEYVTTTITLSSAEYQKFKEDLHGSGRLNGAKGFKDIGAELLDHHTARHFDSWGAGAHLFAIKDTFEDEVYTE